MKESASGFSFPVLFPYGKHRAAEWQSRDCVRPHEHRRVFPAEKEAPR